jgi:hypothetical protein
MGERGEADAPHSALEEPTSECCCTERRLGQASTVLEQQLAFEEALVEARVVRNEELLACEGEEAPENGGDGGRTSQLLFAQSGETGDRFWKRDCRVHE